MKNIEITYDDPKTSSTVPRTSEAKFAAARLLACPFCGELPTYEARAQGHAPGYYWPHQIVHDCKTLGIQMCIRSNARPDTKEHVFHVWNTRATGQANDISSPTRPDRGGDRKGGGDVH